MSFTKPYTYTDGLPLSANGQEANEEGAKVYVNQEIETSDIQDNTLDTTDFAPVRFYSVGATGDFVSKTIQGGTDLQRLTNRAYFTSTAKLNRQNKKDIFNWQAVPNASAEVFVDRANAFFLITVYLKATALANTIVGGNGGVGQKQEEALIAIQQEDPETGISFGYLDLTTGFVFDPDGTYDSALSDYDPADGGTSSSQRSMTLQYRGLINGRGRKRFSVVVSPKMERGFISVKSITVETFYM